jgi:hypothetical protein
VCTVPGLLILTDSRVLRLFDRLWRWKESNATARSCRLAANVLSSACLRPIAKEGDGMVKGKVLS